MSDRLTDRGGAYWHLLGVIARQVDDNDVCLVVGRADDGVSAACEVRVVPGLDARTREPVDLAPLIAELAPDVVHVHTVMNPEALEQIGGLDRVARVMTVQDHRYFCPGKGKWTEDGEVCSEPMSGELCAKCFSDPSYYADIMELTSERRAALQAFRIVVLSEYMKRELGEPDAFVIPPFVHGLDADAEPDGPPCVLFAGRLVAAKGVDDAIAAWKRSGVQLPLVFAGTGALREAVDGCEVLGWVSRRRMASLYRRAAAVIMPCRWQEPFGIVGLEAMTLGTTVAAWKSGGISEWHPGPLPPWGDAGALAAALDDAIGKPADAPPGFDADTLMNRLTAVYAG